MSHSDLGRLHLSEDRLTCRDMIDVALPSVQVAAVPSAVTPNSSNRPPRPPEWAEATAAGSMSRCSRQLLSNHACAQCLLCKDLFAVPGVAHSMPPPPHMLHPPPPPPQHPHISTNPRAVSVPNIPLCCSFFISCLANDLTCPSLHASHHVTIITFQHASQPFHSPPAPLSYLDWMYLNPKP